MRNGVQNARIEFELPVTWKPKHGVPVERIVRRRVLEPHLLPARVELLGENHRDGRVDALPHLDLRHDQRRRAARIDADERVRLERRGLRARRSALRKPTSSATAEAALAWRNSRREVVGADVEIGCPVA